MTNKKSIEWVAVACLQDNYAWLLHADGETAVIDAPEAAPIQAALVARGWTLNHIVLTHHHSDHIDGVGELATPGVRVWGNAADAARLPPLTDPVSPGDRFTICGTTAIVFDAPGHTIGHIAYHMPDAGLIFTGDSLMSWGCGRLFEGTPEQMFTTLAQIAALPDDTLIFSGHEYTQSNGEFALHLEPDHPALRARMSEVKALRAAQRPTVPATLSLEKATNPFLRSDQPTLRRALGLADDATSLATFTEARRQKGLF